MYLRMCPMAAYATCGVLSGRQVAMNCSCTVSSVRPGTSFAFTSQETSIVVADSSGTQHELEADAALSGEMTWSPDGQALLLAPWDADTSSTVVDLTADEPVVSSVRFEFDASPPFISPPQWAPSVSLPPAQNAAIVPPTSGPP